MRNVHGVFSLSIPMYREEHGDIGDDKLQGEIKIITVESVEL